MTGSQVNKAEKKISPRNTSNHNYVTIRLGTRLGSSMMPHYLIQIQQLHTLLVYWQIKAEVRRNHQVTCLPEVGST